MLVTVSGTADLEIGVKPGSLLQFHSSAQGKVALAFCDPDTRARVLQGSFERWTPHTIVERDALVREVERIREQGWAVAPNEALIGLNTLAAPIFGASGAYVGSLGMVNSIQHIPAIPTSEQIRQILRTARNISEALGFKE